MEELLLVILQFLLESGLDIISGLFDIGDLPGVGRFFEKHTPALVYAIILFTVGALLGALSLLLLPHTLLHHGSTRVANLILGPLISAETSRWLARFRQSKPDGPSPRERFWRSFAITLGFVVLRFIYGNRG